MKHTQACFDDQEESLGLSDITGKGTGKQANWNKMESPETNVQYT